MRHTLGMICRTMRWADESSTIGSVTASTRIHIVDADPSVFDSIAERAASAGFVPVAYHNAGEFTSRFSPDVLSCVILDARTRDINSLKVLREIRRKPPETPVIMVSDHADIHCVVESMRNGAVDFLEKPVQAVELFDHVLRAIELAQIEWRRSDRCVEIQKRIDRLTPRVFQVMTLLRQGRTVKEIACDLGLSPKTVQIHRARVLRHMGVDSVVLLANLLTELDIWLNYRPAH